MNVIIIISVLSLSAQVRCSEPRRETKPCSGSCDKYDVDSKNHEFSKTVELDMTVHKRMTCTPDSYFKSISYDDTYLSNQTCFGSFYTIGTNVQGIYTGQPRSGGRPIVLNAKKQIKTNDYNNGNNHRIEESYLWDSGVCGDGLLVAVGDYIASDPVKGCCSHDIGVNGLIAVAYDLVIYGKCCSRCHLQDINAVYHTTIYNDGVV